MNKISGKNERTVVKIFINTLATTALLFPPFASAETTGTNGTPQQGNGSSQQQQPPQQQAPVIIGGTTYDKCKDARDKMDRAQEKIGEACRKAGLGDAKSCTSKARSCDDASSSESFDTVGALATVLGAPGINGNNLGNACPQMNGRDYFAEKDRLQKEIKDTEKELADLNDDKAKIQDDYNKEVQKIQETLTKAQEDYKKQEADIDQAEREQIADFTSNQNKAKEEMRQKGNQILKLQGDLVNLDRNKARALGTISEAAAKRSCVAKIAQMKQDYEKIYSTSSAGASTNFIAQAKRKKQELQTAYNECMNDFNQQRIALNEQSRSQREQLEQQIRDAQSSVDEIQNTLNLASSQLEEIKQSNKKKKSDALQSVIDLGTRSQQQMQSAYQKLQENLKTITAKTASLQAALNRANNSLMTLGPAPKSKSADYTPSEAASEISSQLDILRNVSATYADCGAEKDRAKKMLSDYGTR